MDNLSVWLSVNALMNDVICRHVKASVYWLISLAANSRKCIFFFSISGSLLLKAVPVKSEYSAWICSILQKLG